MFVFSIIELIVLVYTKVFSICKSVRYFSATQQYMCVSEPRAHATGSIVINKREKDSAIDIFEEIFICV